MRVKRMGVALLLAVGAAVSLQAVQPGPAESPVVSVEFIGMPAPATREEQASVYTGAQVQVTYRNGQTRLYGLDYHELMGTGDVVGGSLVGGLRNAAGEPLEDQYGQLASDAPDGNSPLSVPGLRATQPRSSRGLALVTQFEYRDTPPGYPGFHAARSGCG